MLRRQIFIILAIFLKSGAILFRLLMRILLAIAGKSTAQTVAQVIIIG